MKTDINETVIDKSKSGKNSFYKATTYQLKLNETKITVDEAEKTMKRSEASLIRIFD